MSQPGHFISSISWLPACLVESALFVGCGHADEVGEYFGVALVALKFEAHGAALQVGERRRGPGLLLNPHKERGLVVRERDEGGNGRRGPRWLYAAARKKDEPADNAWLFLRAASALAARCVWPASEPCSNSPLCARVRLPRVPRWRSLLRSFALAKDPLPVLDAVLARHGDTVELFIGGVREEHPHPRPRPDSARPAEKPPQLRQIEVHAGRLRATWATACSPTRAPTGCGSAA